MELAIRHSRHMTGPMPWWGWTIFGVVVVLAIIGRVNKARRASRAKQDDQ